MGRFIGVFLMYWFRPRIVFGIYMTMCIVFIAPAITQRENTGIAMLYLTLFFESICFPTIVGLGMRGLGRHTKRGSGFIVGGVAGGAVVPPLLGVAADRYGTGTAMFVPLIFFVGSFTYAVAVNFFPAYRDTIDAFSETKVGLKDSQSTDEEMKVGTVRQENAAPATKEAEA